MKRPPKRPYAHARRQAQLKANNRRGLILIGASAVAVLLVVGFGLSVKSEEINKSTGCPMSHHAPMAHTVVLLDETDELNRSEIEYARAVIMDEYYWLPIGGRLTVRNIVSDPEDASDIVVCRLDDGAKVLGLGKNPKKVKQDFQKIAGAKLSQLLVNVATAPVQEFSPIAETVSDVLDRPEFGANVKARRLVIISDMAQHSHDFSQYGASPAKPQLREFKRDMSGIEVRIHYVPRHSLAKLQTEAHRHFWLNYFKGMGAEAELGHALLLGEDTNKETWSDVPN